VIRRARAKFLGHYAIREVHRSILACRELQREPSRWNEQAVENGCRARPPGARPPVVAVAVAVAAVAAPSPSG